MTESRCIPNRTWRAVLAGVLSLLPSGQSLAETVTVQLLQTTDVHARLEADDTTSGHGGWLRLATLIRRRRRDHGAAKTLLIDCGDTCQGST